MRYSEFKIVEGAGPPALQWGNFSKKGRLEANVATFINKISSHSPFLLTTGQQFVVDDTPENKNLVQSWQGGIAPKVTGHIQGDSKTIPMGLNKFSKTNEFGGMAAEPGAEAGKEAMQGRTAHLNLHGISKEEEKAEQSAEGSILRLVKERGIQGSDLTSKIINNPVLQQAKPQGNWIINIAQNIESQQYPVPVPDELLDPKNAKYLKFVQDYAGEYLGIAGLVNGLGDFPRLGGFLQFLGANNLSELQYYFPQGENTPLADSFGYITTPNGEHQMYLSSKGGNKGAAPSMSNLKIPENLPEGSRQTEEAKTFLRIVQDNSQIDGSLKALNYLGEINSGNLTDQKLAQLLPLQDDEIDFFASRYAHDASAKEPVTINDVPKRLKNYIAERMQGGGVSIITGDFIMACTKCVVDSINKNNILPEFSQLTKEILGFNFVQIFTKIGKRPAGMSFRVLWPAKIDGEVEAYSNSSQKDLKGKLGFRIH